MWVVRNSIEFLTVVIEIEKELTQIAVRQHLSPGEAEGLSEMDILADASGYKNDPPRAYTYDTGLVGITDGHEFKFPIFEGYSPWRQGNISADQMPGRSYLHRIEFQVRDITGLGDLEYPVEVRLVNSAGDKLSQQVPFVICEQVGYKRFNTHVT